MRIIRAGTTGITQTGLWIYIILPCTLYNEAYINSDYMAVVSSASPTELSTSAAARVFEDI